MQIVKEENIMQYIIMITVVLGLAIADFITGIIKAYITRTGNRYQGPRALLRGQARAADADSGHACGNRSIRIYSHNGDAINA